MTHWLQLSQHYWEEQRPHYTVSGETVCWSVFNGYVFRNYLYGCPGELRLVASPAQIFLIRADISQGPYWPEGRLGQFNINARHQWSNFYWHQSAVCQTCILIFIIVFYIIQNCFTLPYYLLTTKFPLNGMFSVKMQRKQIYLSQSCHINEYFEDWNVTFECISVLFCEQQSVFIVWWNQQSLSQCYLHAVFTVSRCFIPCDAKLAGTSKTWQSPLRPETSLSKFLMSVWIL